MNINKKKKIYTEIFKYINSLEIIDTHEHLPGKEEDRELKTDILREYVKSYFGRNLISAGLTESDYYRVVINGIDLLRKWEIVEPYWGVFRYSGHGQMLDIIARDIYRVDCINGSTIEELNSKFIENIRNGCFKKILKGKCKLITSFLVVDTLSEDYDPASERSIYCDRDFFEPVYNIKRIVFPQSWEDIEKIEEESGLRITSFDKYLQASEVLIEKASEMGATTIKNSLAYQRSLRFCRPSRAIAENNFNNIFKTIHYPDWKYKPLFTGKDFQDYMFHHILDLANKKNMVVQIHTGLHACSPNIISNSNPELLTNLFLEYPDIIFVIFHIGYPYQNELTVLAKNFANVFIDMCWAHIVSPNASVNALLEWFDTLPLSKVSAFGGDSLFIDGVYGSLKLAQHNVAKALTIKVDETLFDIERAKEIAKMLFYDNPKKILQVKPN